MKLMYCVTQFVCNNHALNHNYKYSPIYAGEIAVMEMLLTNGINVNVRLSGDNNTLLHFICLNSLGFEQINSRYLTINDKDYNMRNVPFELLLSTGADINAINSKGNTPIHFCATSSNYLRTIYIFCVKIDDFH